MKFYKLLLNTILTGVLSTIVFGGISANADEITETATIDYNNLPTHVENVYLPNRFNLSTVSVDDISTDSELSLEEYVVQEIRNFNDTIDLSKYQIDASSLSDMLNKINLTYPDVFYLELNYRYAINSNSKVTKLKLEYSCTKEEYSETIQLIDDKFSEVISTLNDDMSDYEKALLIHDYICRNFAYDTRDTNENHKLDGFVKDGIGVCQAYMSAYAYALNKVGIKSYPVMSNAIGHTWNMVLLDGKYYQVDVTWDDFVPDLFGWADHTNFLLTDSQVSSSRHGNEWFMYENDDTISATDETFINHKFKSLKFPIVYLNNKLYCIDKGVFSEYNLIENTMNPIADILSDERWYNYNASIKGVYYLEKYSSLNPYKDVIFYNSPNEVIAMDINGNVLDTLYSREAGQDSIYGITIKDGILMAQIEISLNAESDNYGKTIVNICNVEEWYQEYLNRPATTTETTLETTTETTTSTTTEDTTTTTVTTTDTTPIVTTTIETTVPTSTTIPDTTTLQTTTESIINMYCLDINGDDSINSLDLLALKSYLVLNDTMPYYYYDVNNDGSVNILDILILKNNIINTKE